MSPVVIVDKNYPTLGRLMSELNSYNEEVNRLQCCAARSAAMVHRIHKDIGSMHMHLVRRVPAKIVGYLNALVLKTLAWLQAHCDAADEALGCFKQDQVPLYLPFNHSCAYAGLVTYTLCSAASIHVHQAMDKSMPRRLHCGEFKVLLYLTIENAYGNSHPVLET